MANISKVSGVAAASIKKIDGVSKASIGKLNELSFSSTASIITTNLIQHLDAGDTSSYSGSGTTWYDLTSNNLDGTFRGSPTHSSTEGGGSFFFDGVDDAIKYDYDDAALLRIGEDSGEVDAIGTSGISRTYGNLDDYGGFTFQAWVKLPSGSSPGALVPFTNNTSVTSSEATSNRYKYYQGIEVFANGNNRSVMVLVFDGNGGNSSSDRRRFKSVNNSLPTNGTWVNIACTLPNDDPLPLTGGKIYIDGSEVSGYEYSNGTGSGLGYRSKYSSSQGHKYHAGIALNRGTFRTGYLAESLLYNDVLTSTEVVQNYNATKARYGHS